MLISSAMASSSDRSTSAFARVALLALVLGMVDHEGDGRRQSQGNCRCETEVALRARVAWLKSSHRFFASSFSSDRALRIVADRRYVTCPRYLQTLFGNGQPHIYRQRRVVCEVKHDRLAILSCDLQPGRHTRGHGER